MNHPILEGKSNEEIAAMNPFKNERGESRQAMETIAIMQKKQEIAGVIPQAFEPAMTEPEVWQKTDISSSARVAGSTREVVAHPGTDARLLRHPQDPSGFLRRGFTQTQLEGWTQFIADVYADMLGKIPQEFAELSADAPSKIPLYCMSFRHKAAKAMTQSDESRLRYQTTESDKAPRGFDEAKLYGVCVNAFPADTPQQWKHIIQHELLHVITRRGLHESQHSRMEALISPLEVLYGIKADDTTSERKWSHRYPIATAGLVPPDFTRIEHSGRASLNMQYFDARLTVHDITVDECWKIWKLLSEYTKNEGVYPRNAEVNAVIRVVMQDRGETLLQRPSFRPISPGNHHFAVRSEQGDRVLLHNFHVHQTSSAIPSEGGHAVTRYQTQDLNGVPYSHVVYNKRGDEVREIIANGESMATEQFDFLQILDRIRNSGQHGPWAANQVGKKMRYQLGDGSSFELRRPK